MGSTVRTMRRLAVVVIVMLATAIAGPVGASGSVQVCVGPSASTQSGRATITPGVTALSLPQQISAKISLFSCSPSTHTKSSGTLNSTITPAGRQTCKMFTTATHWTAKAKITWKSGDTSTIPLTYSLTGSSQLVNVKGTVGSGLFAGHAVSGQFRYKEVVSPVGKYPNGDGSAQACINKVPPKQYGRIAIVSLALYTTKHFVIS